MAITIDSQPAASDLKSPYRPLEVTVTSDNTSSDVTPTVYTSKMKCFIYLDGSGTADNANNPIILDPDFGTSYTFTFDISGYLAGLDTLTHTIQTKGAAISAIDTTTNSSKSVYLKFTEVLYDTSTQTLSDGATSSASNTFYIINGVWPHDEVANEFTDFRLERPGGQYFLTNNRSTRDIGVNESYYLSFWRIDTNTRYFRVRTWTGANATGSSNNYYRSIALARKTYDIPCGPANINATTGSWYSDLGVTPTSDPTIDGTIGSYQVTWLDGGSSLISETVTFNLDHNPCTNEWTRIKFLNRLGAFEYFTFKGYRNKSINIRKNYYQRPLAASYTVDQGGDRTMYTDSRTQFVVYSQQLKQADREWLIEMLEGNECFVEEGSNYIPIKVRAGGTQLINEGDGLMTIKMTYEYANPNRRQHGGY